jgi:site-specific recombinase XerD
MTDLIPTHTPTPAQDYQAATAYLASLKSAVGRRGMLSQLRKVARILGAPDIDAVNWATLNAANVRAILSALSTQNLAPASIATALNALKGVARAAWERGTLDTETYQRIRSIRPPAGSRLPAGRDIDAGERLALMQTTARDRTPAGVRDAAILAMLIATGMRRAELCALRTSDVDLETGRLRIIGKGDKERTAYLRNGALRYLRDWLAIRGDGPGPIFCRVNKGGRIFPDQPLSTTAMHKIITKRAAEAGLSDITPHDFRRTYAGELLDAGQDIATVAALLGHASVSTTARYDRRGERAKEAAAACISVPYFGGQA